MARCSAVAVTHLNVMAAVALLALDLAVVFVLLAAIPRCRAFRRQILDGDLRRCLPSWNLPNHTGETLDFEAALLPFATWLARSIECSETCIDGTLVGFGTEFVGSAIRGSGNGGRVIDGTILPERKVSKAHRQDTNCGMWGIVIESVRSVGGKADA